MVRLPGRTPPPTDPVGVVLASTGVEFTEEAIRAAADASREAGNAAVAVVSIARMHGYALGMPNPGLLPTRKEKAAQEDIVSAAIRRLQGWGVAADGQVVITRNPAKSVAAVAVRRHAGQVVIQLHGAGRLRRLLEGDPVGSLRRRLRGRCEIQSWPG